MRYPYKQLIFMRGYNMKKPLIFFFSFIFLVLAAQNVFSAATDYASLNSEILSAAPNPAVNNIDISTPSLHMQGNLGIISDKTINFQSIDPSGKTAIDGAGVYRGFSANAGSNLSFTGIDFFNAATAQDGGFVSVRSSTVSFNGSAAMFKNGSARSGGAVYASNNSFMHFADGAVFDSNKASDLGGGFYSARTRLVFDGNAEFINNVSEYSGGGFYADSKSDISFNGHALFKSNVSTDNNGAGFYAYRSALNFASAGFENNISHDIGGGFYASQCGISFSGDASFSGNRAKYAGGALTAGNGSNISFGGNALFSLNSAGEGGAVRTTASNITFGQNAAFENNSAAAGGGALKADNSSKIIFNADSLFNNNTAGYDGGAVTAFDSEIIFNANSAFENNSAKLGGAFHLSSSKLVLSDSVFEGNTALSAGGAIYMTGTADKMSLLTVNTGTETIFRNNKADNSSNALYLGDYSRAVFNTAAGASVQMRDSVSASRNHAELELSGEGAFNLYNSLTGADVFLSGANGSSFNLMGGGSVNAGRFIIGAASRFNSVNGSADEIKVSSLGIDGTLAVEISQTGVHDRIFSSGAVNIGGSGTLEVATDIADPAGFRKKTFMIINTPESINGIFGTVNVTNPVFVNAPVVNYGDLVKNWITITLLGDNLSTNYLSLKGLSFNQRQTAKNYDALSADASGDLDTVISLIEAFDEDGKKKALAQSSGYFLANIIRSASADAESNEIYDRIKNHCMFGETENGLWAQFRGAATAYSKDGNSLNDFKDSANGVMIGFDRFMEDKKIMLGAYFKHNDRDISQADNEADITNTGLGIYGGLIERDWEIKALVSGAYDNYDTKRDIPFAARKAKAVFEGTSFGADIEGAVKFKAGEYINLRPYMGMEAKNSYHNGFTEKGAESLGLEVLADSYMRSAARLGAGAVFDNNIFSWHINAEIKYLISGEAPEIESAFKGSSRIFRSRGSTEGRMIGGAAAGAAVRITKELKLFVNGNYYGADHFRHLYGNIGLRWNFCSHNKESGAAKTDKEALDAALSLLEPQPQEAKEMDAVIIFEEAPLSYGEESADEPAQDASRREEEIKEQEEVNPEIDMEDEKVIEQQQKEAALRRSKPVLKSFSLNMANFDTGRSSLSEKAKENIRMQAAEIKKFEFTKITIEGHTDSTGSAAINKKLSRERAKAVFDIFAQEEIPVKKMSYIGFSSLLPLASNNTIEGRAKNRRVEIFVE